MNELQAALLDIQQELKAPKNQYNKFAGFYFRSAEDILEGLKPLLKKHKVFQKVTDEVVTVGMSNYLKATVIVTKGEFSEQVCGWAREEESLKGQIAAQITGGASSYAKKYALNNMYNIDDTKDPDTQDNSKSKTPTKTEPKKEASNLATDAQRKLISDKLGYIGFTTPEEIKNYLATEYGVTGLLTKDDASMVIYDLNNTEVE